MAAFHHSNLSCSHCSLPFKSKQEQADHFSYEHFEWFCWICDDCGVQFALQCDLDCHVATAHATEVLRRSQQLKQAALASKGTALGKRKRKASVTQLPTPDTLSPQSNSTSCTPPNAKKLKTAVQQESTSTYSYPLCQESLTGEQTKLRMDMEALVVAVPLDPPSQPLPQPLVNLGYLPHHFDPRTVWRTDRGGYRDIPCELPEYYIFRAHLRLIAYGNLFRLAQRYSNAQIVEKVNEGRSEKILKNTQAVCVRVQTAVRAMGQLWPNGEQGVWEFLDGERAKHGVPRSGKKRKRKNEVQPAVELIPDFEFD